MRSETLATFLCHVSLVLGLPECKINTFYRGAREKGIISNKARGVNAKIPSDLERRMFLRFIAITLMKPRPKIPLLHNPLDSYRDLGVRIEQIAGMSVSVEISPSAVRSILDFGVERTGRRA